MGNFSLLNLYFLIVFIIYSFIITVIEIMGFDYMIKTLMNDNSKESEEFKDLEITKTKLYLTILLICLFWPISLTYIIINKNK